MDDISNNANTDILARKLQEGLATKEERGIALKTINTQLAIDLVSTLDDIKSYTDKLKAIKKKMSEKFIQQMELAIETNTVELDDLYSMLNGIMENEFKTANLYRQVIQGNRMLFDEDSLSEEDKIIIRVLRSFDTEDRKKDFLNIIEKYEKEQNSGDIQEAHIVSE